MAAKKKPRRNEHSANGKRRLNLLILGTAGAVAVATAVAAFLAFGGDDPPKRSLRQDPVVTDAMDVSVKVVDRDYEPRDLTIKQGATVTWKWDGNLPHNVVDDRGAFESPILNDGDEWSLTFDNTGEFYYYCTLHHSMQGTVHVVQ